MSNEEKTNDYENFEKGGEETKSMPYAPVVYIHFCTHETEQNIQSLVVCVMQKYRLLRSSSTRHNDEKSENKNKRKLL